ncbi:MAG: NADH-quinone oxidoreductase subunit H [Eggerthellaceae bacterium]|nr:NADH-quinone oxidoreductase subunit H [Eggerthellaceae bacterium]
MPQWSIILIATVAFAILAPIIGCLLAGVDRKLSARLQGRVGPSMLQPYYDMRKLLEKDDVSVNTTEGVYVTCALIFAIVAGGIFYGGGNLLLCVFVITLASLFFIMAAYSTRSPYAEVGANRETVQVMSYEPMVLLMTVVFFMATGSFYVSAVFGQGVPVIAKGFLAFIGVLFILTINLRKSPFDISMSHHAHQEIVRGMTTEMSGPTLAKVEIMHWCENVLFLGWIGMFFVWGGAWTIVIGIVAAVLAYLLEIFIDNNFARVKWQAMLKWSWIVALVLGGVNVALLMFGIL